MIRSLIFILAFAIIAAPARATDDKSIKGFQEALAALGPDVDPQEAKLVSVTAHTTWHSLLREYNVIGPPGYHNFLINIGLRKRGFCYDWVRDIGARLKELKPKTLALHWALHLQAHRRRTIASS